MSSVALHCQRLGSGPDLVLLHGWALHSGIWSSLLEPLSAQFTLHLYDLPGHGRSASVASLTLESICAALAETAPARAAWLGWSLGGSIALAFAARHPQRVSHLLLVASNPRFTAIDGEHAGMAPTVLADFAKELETDHAATLSRFLGLIARGAPDTSVLKQLHRAMAEAPPPTLQALRGGLTILRDTDQRAQLARLSMPAYLLAGERDTLVPIAALRALAREHPRLNLRVFAQAGHAPFISQPQQFVRTIMESVQ